MLSVFLNGVDVYQNGDLLSDINLVDVLTDEYGDTAGSVEISLVDPNQTWFTYFSEPRTITVSGAGISFQAESDVQTVKWSQQDRVTQVTFPDRWATAKQIELEEAEFTRDSEDSATVAHDVPSGATRIYTNDLIELYPGDTISAEIIDDEFGNSTVEMSVVAMFPGSAVIAVAEGVSYDIPAGTALTRKNHERRFVSTSEAIERINELVGATLSNTAIIDNTQPVTLPERALFPIPVPVHPTAATGPGMLLAGSLDGQGVISWFSSKITSQNLVSLVSGEAPVFSTWPRSGTATTALPVDWTRQQSTPPPRLLPGLFTVPRTRFNQKPSLWDGDDLSVVGPDGRPNYTIVRYADETGYELRNTSGNNWRIYRWVWDGADYPSGTLTGDLQGTTCYGLAVTPTNLQTIASTVSGPVIHTITYAGSWTDTGVVVRQPVEGGIAGVGDWVLALDETGSILSIWKHDLLVVTEIESAGQWQIHTACMIENDIAIINTNGRGTELRIISTQTFTNIESHVITSYQDDLAFMVSVAENEIWISTASQLWLYSTVYHPVFARMDVGGSTIDELMENALVLSQGYIRYSYTGTVWVKPLADVYSSSVVRTTIEDEERLDVAMVTPNWYTTVTVKGNDVQGTATTDEIGPSLSIDCQFIETASHCAALALLILERVKNQRRQYTGEVTERLVAGTKIQLSDSRVALVLSAEYDFVQDITTLVADEVFS